MVAERDVASGCGPDAEFTVGDAARYRGLIRCDNLWVCLDCAHRITSRRQAELQSAMKQARELGLRVGQDAFTLPHTRFDRLDALTVAYKRAFHHLTGDKRYRALMLSLGRVHHVRSWECTVSVENGWHPHGHEMSFYSGDGAVGVCPDAWLPVLEDLVQDRLAELWLGACRWAGIAIKDEAAFLKHAVSVQFGYESVDAYIAKWGCNRAVAWNAASELTRGPAKRRRRAESGDVEHINPLYLPVLAAERCSLRRGMSAVEVAERVCLETQYRAWWLEYASAFAARHQLQWSRGAKEALLVKELEPKEIEDAPERPKEKVTFWAIEWVAVERAGLDGELLDDAVKYGRAGVLAKIRMAVWWLTEQEVDGLEFSQEGRYRLRSKVYDTCGVARCSGDVWRSV